MEYRWDDYSLNREGSLLMRQGQQIDVSRKVLDCVNHLIEHRQRVVSYDELIQKVWGHDSVTNHQLSQVVLAARRALGDDGHTQRLIRTMPGLGYRWVGELSDVADNAAAPQAQTPTPDVFSPVHLSLATPEPESSLPSQAHVIASASEPRAAASAWHRSRTLIAVVASSLILAAAASSSRQSRQAEAIATVSPTAAVAAEDPLARIEEALWRGEFEEARDGLATLPADLADSPDARILDFKLDIERGRFDRAAEKLAQEQTRAKAAADTVWQAKLLIVQTVLNAKTGRSGQDVLAAAQSAVELLKSAGDAASPQLVGEALYARGSALMKAGQFELAMQDTVRARDILLKAGDNRRAAIARGGLARAWMRTGRLTDALEQMTEIAVVHAQFQDPVSEIASRNTAAKIQVELLRWSDALASTERSIQLLQSVPDSVRRARTMQLRALVLTGSGRLREAGSLLEEVDAMDKQRRSLTIPAIYHLASGQAELALAAAAEAFGEDDTNDKTNLILENKEGALLLWMVAAQDLVANGRAMPVPSPAQRKALQQPESSIGHIARGRWLWSQGQPQQAVAAFHLALEQAQQTNQLHRMLLASEPLIELLLQRGERVAAVQVLAKLRAHDPERLDQDYRASLLGLKLALAMGDDAATTAAYRNARALAGERTLPSEVVKAYAHQAPLTGKPDFNGTARLSP
jgi:DNA-binding winged helix-turn-helix (wHTH) protein/tetratricopeptide (TPR) repeat protein